MLVLIGVGLLYLGGEGLVRGATSAGRRLGLQPMVVGLTIVSVGTSSPELAATLTGVVQGAPALAFGNVVGSNISNLSLVLGITVLIGPLAVAARFIRRDAPFMIAISTLLYWLVSDGQVSRLEGLVLLAILVVYLWRLLRSRPETPQVKAEFEEISDRSMLSPWVSVLAIAAGIGLLVVGAQVLIKGAVALAQSIGISERVIGLTVVALGTSLPELASSIVAAAHREGDVVLGNLIGSNLFNILFILGTTSLVQPILVESAAVWTDIHVMVGISVLAWIFLRTRSYIGRAEGLALLLLYLGYVYYLFT